MTMPSIRECRLAPLSYSLHESIGIRLTDLQSGRSCGSLPRLTLLHPCYKMDFGDTIRLFLHLLFHSLFRFPLLSVSNWDRFGAVGHYCAEPDPSFLAGRSVKRPCFRYGVAFTS